MTKFKGLMGLILLSLLSGCTPTVLQIGTDLSTAKEVVAEGDVNMQNSEGESALHYAARKGDIKIVRYLVEHGAKLDVKSVWKNTPLIDSITHENQEVSLYLIEAGADIKIKNKWSVSPFLSAASFGNIEVIKSLHSKGADIETVNTSSDTPLMLAAKGGHVEVLAYLLKHGADKSVRNKNLLSALDIAKHSEQVEIISLLQNYNEIKTSYTKRDKKHKVLEKSTSAKKKIFANIHVYIEQEDLNGLIRYIHTLE
ncbi:ankyrin repeat domain-containing protein [Sulfurimonas sp. MAG313]|nr:ankyrin repeat domain-containing protein [Sulfurimonas sp. MAG313]MDF1880542.1 ankyrin repeat domain-containing protein [Sulfurimonas sp. MAG313]